MRAYLPLSAALWLLRTKLSQLATSSRLPTCPAHRRR